MGWEREMTGLTTGEHVLAFYRKWLAERGVISSRELSHRAKGFVRVAGEVVVHQAPPTAKGVHFVTLEDEHGLVNVVVRPEVYTEYRTMWRLEPLLVVEGRVQRGEGTVNLVAQRATPLRHG
jgi:error-prone DNA polymerase